MVDGQWSSQRRPVQHTSTATPSAEDDFDKLPPDSDLPQRPRMTLSPGVRIEGSAHSLSIMELAPIVRDFAIAMEAVDHQ
jgi:hypothetical protein